MNKEDLLKLKTEVDKSKQKLAEIKAEEKLLMKQLKENWDCDSLEEANSLLATLKKELAEEQLELETAKYELEEKYGAN